MSAHPQLSRKLLRLLPLAGLVCFIGIAGFLLAAGGDVHRVDSALVGKPLPEKSLGGLSAPELRKGAVMINFFASWCLACVADQQVFAHIASTDPVAIYGIAYKDKPADTAQWLALHGNPFTATGTDPSGAAALDWGVYGVPETYVVVDGIVRLRYAGALTMDVYQTQIRPLLQKAGAL